MMDRRTFLRGLTLGAVSAPLSAEAQPGKLPLVAILQPSAASEPQGGVVSFKEALAQLGWIEGRTVRFETRYGDWQPARMAEAAKDLVGLKPDVLFTNSEPGVRAAMQATTSIPIVVGAASDLVAMGAVKNLAHPGGNVTGVTHGQPELDRKRLELLTETLRSPTRIAYLFNPDAVGEPALRALDESARRLGVRVLRVGIRTPGEIEGAFASLVNDGAQAVLVQDSALLARHADRVTALAIKHRLPAIGQSPGFAERGGLLQYGADVYELFKRSATHVNKILRGAKPGISPSSSPRRFGWSSTPPRPERSA